MSAFQERISSASGIAALMVAGVVAVYVICSMMEDTFKTVNEPWRQCVDKPVHELKRSDGCGEDGKQIWLPVFLM